MQTPDAKKDLAITSAQAYLPTNEAKAKRSCEMKNILSAGITDYEIVEKFTLPTGHFLLEYAPPDVRNGMPSYVYKTPLIGFVDCSIGSFAKAGFKHLRRWLPVTVNGVQYHEEDQHLTILLPCGGVQYKDVFLDCLDDFMQAMDYRHEDGLKT